MSPGTNDGPRNTGTLPKSNRRNDRNRERSAINQQIPLPRPVFHRDFSQQSNNLLQLDSQPVSEREPRRSNKNSNTRSTVSAPSVVYHDFPDFEGSSRQPSLVVEERPQWQRMAPPFDSHSQPPPQFQGTKPTNVDKMPDRGQVESRLNQIRDYIRVTSTMMDSLSQSTDPRAHAQRDKLSRMVEDLHDSETKLANLLEQYHGRGIPDESGDHVQRTSDQMRRFTDLLDVLALQERYILTNSNSMNGDIRREPCDEVRDGGREDDLRRKVEESQRKLTQLLEHQADLVGMQLRTREKLNEARQAQQALLLEEEQAAPAGFWEEANVLPEQGPTNVAQLETETAVLRGKLAQLQCKKQRMDHLVAELQAVDMSDRASFSSDGSRAVGRDKAAELDAMKAQLSHLKALMEEATRVRQRSESTSEADLEGDGAGEEAEAGEPARSSRNSFVQQHEPEEASQKKSWNSEDKLTVDQMQAVTRELKEQSALLRAARAELQRLKQPSASNSAVPVNSAALPSTSTPPSSLLGTGVAEKKQSNNSSNNNSNGEQQLAQAKRRQLEELMRKEQGHSSRINQDVAGGDWASHRDTNSQLSHNSSTPANLWPLPNATAAGGSNDHSMDGVSSTENLLDIGPHVNGFNGNWWGLPAPPLEQPQNAGVVGSAEYYRQLLLGSQAQQLQMMGTTVQQCCQLLWAQQRELQTMRTAIAQLQLQLRHPQPRTSSADNEEEYSNLSRSVHNLGSGLDAALPPSSSLPNLVSLPIPAPAAAPVPSPQHQPQLNNQVPPGNRANNYWDNFRSYSRQNLLSGSGKAVTERNPHSTPISAGNVATPAANCTVGRVNSTLVSRKDKRNREHRADNLPQPSLSASDTQYSLNLQQQSNLHQHQQEREAPGTRNNVLANDQPQQQQVENLWEEPHSSSSFRLLPGTNGDHCILCHLSGEIQEAMASLVAVNGREPKYLVLILRELKTISEDHRLRPRLLRSLRALQDTHSPNNPLNETTDQTASESCQSSDDDSDIGAYNIGLASNTNTGNHSVLADIKLFPSRPSSPGLAAASAAHIDNAMSIGIENVSVNASVSGTPGYNEDLAEADQSRPDASSNLQAAGEENDNEDEEGEDGNGGAAALILGNLENSFETLDCEGEGERGESEDASLDRVPTRLYHH